jgi:hypothetical protein
MTGGSLWGHAAAFGAMGGSLATVGSFVRAQASFRRNALGGALLSRSNGVSEARVRPPDRFAG